MIKMSLEHARDILDANETSRYTKEIEFQGLSIDSRTLKPGNLFVALSGSRVDGHDFVEEARVNGASCALVSRLVDSPLPQIRVKDIIHALGQLGAAWRNQFNIPVIAATGSNGKTTLKNMIASILVSECAGEVANVLATQGTLNNHLGLPLTLARLNPAHRFAVIELGMNHFGEIAYLTQLTRPNVAVITNAAAAHLEGVGDVAGVARAKSEIFIGMPPSGVAVLNRDDAFYTFWREKIGNHRYLTFGFHPDADVTTTARAQNHLIPIQTPAGKIEVSLPLLGKHNILNALAAVAASLAVGADLAAIKAGLEKTQPAPGRLEMHLLHKEVRIIDDTYNANPVSLKAAVDALATFSGKRILVLGDMKELGEDEKILHQAAGEQIREAGIDYLFTYGDLSASTALAFGEGAYHFNDQEKLVNALKPFLYNHTTILIKGSRSMHMERVVARLVQKDEHAQQQ